jgi:hypothetical protein
MVGKSENAATQVKKPQTLAIYLDTNRQLPATLKATVNA